MAMMIQVLDLMFQESKVYWTEIMVVRGGLSLNPLCSLDWSNIIQKDFSLVETEIKFNPFVHNCQVLI